MRIFKREEKLEAFLLASENNTTGWHSLPGDWKSVLYILWPLKSLNSMVESSSCALCELIPIVEKVLLEATVTSHVGLTLGDYECCRV